MASVRVQRCAWLTWGACQRPKLPWRPWQRCQQQTTQIYSWSWACHCSPWVSTRTRSAFSAQCWCAARCTHCAAGTHCPALPAAQDVPGFGSDPSLWARLAACHKAMNKLPAATQLYRDKLQGMPPTHEQCVQGRCFVSLTHWLMPAAGCLPCAPACTSF